METGFQTWLDGPTSQQHITLIEYRRLARRYRTLGLDKPDNRAIAMGVQDRGSLLRLVPNLYVNLDRTLGRVSQGIVDS